MKGEKGQFLGENVWNSQHVRERCGETKKIEFVYNGREINKIGKSR